MTKEEICSRVGAALDASDELMAEIFDLDFQSKAMERARAATTAEELQDIVYAAIEDYSGREWPLQARIVRQLALKRWIDLCTTIEEVLEVDIEINHIAHLFDDGLRILLIKKATEILAKNDQH